MAREPILPGEAAELSVRSQNIIRNEFWSETDVPRTVTLPEVAAVSKATWLSTPNCGKVSAEEISHWLRHHGYFMGYSSEAAAAGVQEDRLAVLERRLVAVERVLLRVAEAVRATA